MSMEHYSQRPTNKQIRKLYHLGVMPAESHQMTRRECSEAIRELEAKLAATPSTSAVTDEARHVQTFQLNEWDRLMDQQILENRIALKAKRRGKDAEAAVERFFGIAEGSEGMSR